MVGRDRERESKRERERGMILFRGQGKTALILALVLILSYSDSSCGEKSGLRLLIIRALALCRVTLSHSRAMRLHSPTDVGDLLARFSVSCWTIVCASIVGERVTFTLQ